MIKGLLDIFTLLGTDFKKLYAKGAGKLFTLIIRDFSIGQIAFISDKDFDYVFRRMGLDLFHPILQSIKGLEIVSRINHNDAHGSFVIGLGNGFEPFLPSRIPNLHSYLFTINLNRLDLEINAFNQKETYQSSSDEKS